MLVRVHAASIHFGDQMIMRGKPRSRIPGLDIAGTVEAVGTGVTRYGPGEEVFGTCTGALAEYVGTPEDKLDRKPSNLTFEQAAALPTSGLARAGRVIHARSRAISASLSACSKPTTLSADPPSTSDFLPL